jgi:hypothetical protein
MDFVGLGAGRRAMLDVRAAGVIGVLAMIAIGASAAIGSWMAAPQVPSPTLSAMPRPSPSPIAPRLNLDTATPSLQAAFSSAVGASQTRFDVVRTQAGPVAAGGGLSTRFGTGGAIEIRAGGGVVGLRPHGITGSPVLSGSRVSYTAASMNVWYRNGPLGLEQGFMLTRRPTGGSRTLTMALSLSRPLLARATGRYATELVTPAGRTVLRYDGLAAVDAEGRPLGAWLTVTDRQIVIHVAAAGARYPVTVDPLVEQSEIPLSGECAGSCPVALSARTAPPHSSAATAPTRMSSSMTAAGSSRPRSVLVQSRIPARTKRWRCPATAVRRS